MTRVALPRLVAAVALGGAAGAVLRWSLGELDPDGSGFPWTTFAINVVGAFALALLPAISAVRRRQLLTVALGPGVLGGFTTLSAASEQARALLDSGSTGTALAYLLATPVVAVAVTLVAGAWSTPTSRIEFEAEDGDA